MSKKLMVLHHVPNVDIRGAGYWDEKPPGNARRIIPVSSLEDASRKLRQWCDRWGLGGGNIARDCGNVLEDGRLVARISYNGRAWKPGNYPTAEIHLALPSSP